MPKIPVPLLMDLEDVQALERLSRLLHCPKGAVLRYALRHYALAGSWRVGPGAIDPGDPLYAQWPDLGPDGRGVA